MPSHHCCSKQNAPPTWFVHYFTNVSCSIVDMLPLQTRWLRCTLEATAGIPATCEQSRARHRAHPAIIALQKSLERVERVYHRGDVCKIAAEVQAALSMAASKYDPFVASSAPTTSVVARNRTAQSCDPRNRCYGCDRLVRSDSRQPFVRCANGHAVHIRCAESTDFSATCVICDADVNIPYDQAVIPSSSADSRPASPPYSEFSLETIRMRISPTSMNSFLPVDIDEVNIVTVLTIHLYPVVAMIGISQPAVGSEACACFQRGDNQEHSLYTKRL
ncbi:unnamed protein product [Calicophoron daubneyi]|uniref:RING-type domain-containing protein n=1 Tax=Calicophoron daubneyi TaxID=300641 RepID=A0AAV2TPN8_CALDB